MAMYDKLGGISNDNYEKMFKIVYDKIEDLRKEMLAQKGLQGADALQSDEYKEFPSKATI